MYAVSGGGGGGYAVPWGYHDKCGVSRVPWGILSTMGDIMMHLGDIMSTVGVFSTVKDTILCNLSTVGDTMIRVGIS